PARTSSGDPGAHSRNVPDPRLARRSEPRVREAQVADRSDEARLDRGRGADDPAVLREPFALPEIERGAGDVGHDAARLARDDRAGGVVPDLLDVALLRGHAEVGVGLAPRDDGVLRLAVELRGRAGAARVPEDLVRGGE